MQPLIVNAYNRWHLDLKTILTLKMPMFIYSDLTVIEFRHQLSQTYCAVAMDLKKCVHGCYDSRLNEGRKPCENGPKVPGLCTSQSGHIILECSNLLWRSFGIHRDLSSIETCWCHGFEGISLWVRQFKECRKSWNSEPKVSWLVPIDQAT